MATFIYCLGATTFALAIPAIMFGLIDLVETPRRPRKGR